MIGNFVSFLPSGNFTSEVTMHEIKIDDHVVQLNNWQFGTLFFFCLSGLGALSMVLMVIIDIIRWSMQ
jgi:hypothetical protein